MYVYWPIHVCLLAHTCMFTGPYMYVYWLIRVCLLTHTCMFTGSYVYVYWPICVCLLAHMCMFTGSYVYVCWFSYSDYVAPRSTVIMCTFFLERACNQSWVISELYYGWK
jgi:hypothetical protein